MTTAYYLPPACIRGTRVELPEAEARHAVQVLRQRVGDDIVAVDGAGGWYRIRLTEVGKKRAAGEVIEMRRDVGEPAYRLTIGIGLLKNQNRLDVFVEKASELGVSRIVPLVTERTEKKSFREQRAERLLVAAMKQCGRSRLVEVAPVAAYDDLVRASTAQIKLIAHERASSEASFAEALHMHESGGDITVLIGPEGGFTDEEVERALVAGFQQVSLGTRRLRAETAAIAVSAGMMLSGVRGLP